MEYQTGRPRPAAGAPDTALAPRATRRARTAVLSAALLAAGLVLTACGGGDSSTDSGQKSSDSGVASLPTASSGGKKAEDPSAAQSSDAAIEAKRPQVRLDSSQEEIDQLWNVYWACLQAHGVPMYTGRVEHPGDQAPPVQEQKVTDQYKAQYHACLYKMPLQPAEERPETNPHYADDYRAYVKCLRAKGYKVHQVFTSDGNPDGWTFDDNNDGGIPTDKADRDCRLEAFGGKGK